jgi:3',5'-cyclic AMP phosphodiesterase CpdA
LSRQHREPASTRQSREAANVGDPRLGDIEDDASSTKRRSLLSLAGSLFAEISPAKLVVSWTMLFAIPAFLLGLTPLIVSAWLMLVKDKIASPLIGVWPVLMLALLATVALAGARAVFRMAESNFWSLNSLAIEPVYAICREGIRHLATRFLDLRADPSRSARFNAVASLIAGILMSSAAACAALLAWPTSRWLVTITDLASPQTLLPVALANGVVLVAAYLTIAALVWSSADAAMRGPRDLHPPAVSSQVKREWRVAHLSDLHTVGERYGFRIESGRSGPSGNNRLRRTLHRLEQAHASQPIDLILITGDLTDAGRSAEWSELLGELQSHPRLLDRILVLPGNHDLNVVDRSNPAKLDLPLSPHRRLRRLRFLSAVDLIQGDRVRVVDRAARSIGESLSELVSAHRAEMSGFSDTARPLLARGLDDLWAAAFPMIVPPDCEDSLGVILLNSNADTHFSFTNALGMVTFDQLQGIEIAVSHYPRACWIVALHHHVVEYPGYATVLSERIGTALVNGSWFVRRLHKLAEQAVLMHGHRHIDWIGECAGLRIVSAPSQVMEATNGEETCFHIHTLAVTHDGRLCLTGSDRIAVEGDASR